MIEIKNLSVKLSNKQVLDQVSLSIPEGSSICIMGESGAGKTTLLKTIMGLIIPNEGEILGVRRPISVVFQEDRLCEQLSAVKNVMMVLEGKNKRELAKEHLSQLLPLEALSKPTRDLSGGMKRRVSIARAFAHPSNIILMDEPFTGLDEMNKQSTIEYILKEKGNRTMIFITHDEKDAISLQADQIVRL